MTTLRQKLEAAWWEMNGTGTAACPKCNNPRICAWHDSRLDELEQISNDHLIETLERVRERTRHRSTELSRMPKPTGYSWLALNETIDSMIDQITNKAKGDKQ